MSRSYKKVILCRGLSEKSDSRTYEETLETAGYMCSCLPTLCFNFVNLSELRTCLRSPHSYEGLILTSRRTVEAIGLASKEDDSVLQPWKNMPVYCVGPSTQSFAKCHLGSESCFGSEAGNASNLAELLLASVSKGAKPLLYPCSEIGRDTIEKTLNQNDIRVHKIVAYKTLPSETLQQDLTRFMDNNPKIFVFFSPSSVEHVVAVMKKQFYDTSTVKAVAIGPVTRQALIDAGLEVFATASKPDPISLLEALNDAEKSKGNEKTVIED